MSDKTQTEKILELVRAGGHRIESWAHKRGTRYVLSAWREKQGMWTQVTASPVALRLAAARLKGCYIVSLGCMHYTAGNSAPVVSNDSASEVTR